MIFGRLSIPNGNTKMVFVNQGERSERKKVCILRPRKCISRHKKHHFGDFRGGAYAGSANAWIRQCSCYSILTPLACAVVLLQCMCWSTVWKTATISDVTINRDNRLSISLASKIRLSISEFDNRLYKKIYITIKQAINYVLFVV